MEIAKLVPVCNWYALFTDLLGGKKIIHKHTQAVLRHNALYFTHHYLQEAVFKGREKSKVLRVQEVFKLPFVLISMA